MTYVYIYIIGLLIRALIEYYIFRNMKYVPHRLIMLRALVWPLVVLLYPLKAFFTHYLKKKGVTDKQIQNAVDDGMIHTMKITDGIETRKRKP